MPLSQEEIKDLESRIDYRFVSHDYLESAFTHSSVSVEGGCVDYERLEFLGDSILGACIANLLFSTFPSDKEGELSVRLHSLVSGDVCADIANELGLLDFARFGSGFDTTAQRTMRGIASDIFESLLAVIYLDGGMESAHSFISRMYKTRLHTYDVSYNSKTALQEWSHKQGYEEPSYRVCSREGPDHDPSFVVEANVGNTHKSTGKGSSKRVAEIEAAKNLLLSQGVWQRTSDGTIKASKS